MLNQYNRRRCIGNCANCPFFSRTVYYSPNTMLPPNYGTQVNNFFKYMPHTIFWYDSNCICYARYELLQDYLIEYCRKNYPWKTPIYMEVSFGQTVLVSDNYTYEKHIKEIFKTAIDIAAEITKDKSPQQSIMFDEIGFILADDIKEAVRKVISILEKVTNINRF